MLDKLRGENNLIEATVVSQTHFMLLVPVLALV
jgi:hypothetical protein